MAALFDTSTDNISLHLKNVYAEAELVEAATTEDFSVVQEEGTRRVRCCGKAAKLGTKKSAQRAPGLNR